MDWHSWFVLMVISQWTIYLSRITSHLKHCFFFNLDVAMIDGTYNTQWYEFCSSLVFQTCYTTNFFCISVFEMRIRGVLLFYLSVFDSALHWHIIPMKGHSPCNHWLWEIPILIPICISIFRSCIAPNDHISSVWRLCDILLDWGMMCYSLFGQSRMIVFVCVSCIIELSCVGFFLTLQLSWFQPWLC